MTLPSPQEEKKKRKKNKNIEGNELPSKLLQASLFNLW